MSTEAPEPGSALAQQQAMAQPSVFQRTKVAVNLLDPIGDMDQLERVSVMLANSNLVDAALRGKPANVALVIMRGQHLGLTWDQAVDGTLLYVSKSGRVSMTSKLLLYLITRAGHTYEVDDSDPAETRVTLTRGDTGQSYTGSFSVDDALAAQLVTERNGELIARSNNGNPLPWELYRKDMLFARALTRAVNRRASEVAMGMPLPGEDDGYDEPAGPVVAGTVVAPEPPEPGHSPDATAELADIDARARAQDPAAANAGDNGGVVPPGDAKPTATGEASPAAAGDSGAAADGEHGPGETAAVPASSEQITELADMLKSMGWTRAPDRVNAVSLFTRQPIGSRSDLERMLTSHQAEAMLAELAKIVAASARAQTAPVSVLADSVAMWARDWHAADPDGYAAAGHGDPL